VNVGECLYRDVLTGIIQAVVKQTEHGKKVQHRRSLRTTDVAEARLKLAEYRLELAGKQALPPITPPPEVPPPKPAPVTAPSAPPRRRSIRSPE
jgi:hypothetical protein